jgi:hypothetical protein
MPIGGGGSPMPELITPDCFTGAVAMFDVLGFRAKTSSMTSLAAFHDVIGALIAAGCDAEIIVNVDRRRAELEARLGFIQFADTLVMYLPSGDAGPLGSSTRILDSMIYASALVTAEAIRMNIPLRGAIAFGDVLICRDPLCILGKAVLEAHAVGEDQCWSGVALCESAAQLVGGSSNPRIAKWPIPRKKAETTESWAVNWPAHTRPEIAGSAPDWSACFSSEDEHVDWLMRNTRVFYDAMTALPPIGTPQVNPIPKMHRRSWYAKYSARRPTA